MFTQNWHIVSSAFLVFNVCLTLKSFAWRAAFALVVMTWISSWISVPRAWVGTSVRIYSPTCFSRYFRYCCHDFLFYISPIVVFLMYLDESILDDRLHWSFSMVYSLFLRIVNEIRYTIKDDVPCKCKQLFMQVNSFF